MRVNTNVNSLVAYRNLSTANAAVSDSMAKLSTGFRINKAADDAAGLGIANKLRADNRSLQQASRNAEQANSVLQIAEGATSTVQKMLERMKELATQAGSDSVDGDGRARIQSEFKALQGEITRTVDTTKFQGSHLLKTVAKQDAVAGSVHNNAAFTVGTGTANDSTVAADGTYAGTGSEITVRRNAAGTDWEVSENGTDFTAIPADKKVSGLTLTITDGTSPAAANTTFKLTVTAPKAAAEASGGDRSFLVGSSGAYKSDDLVTLKAIDLTTSTLKIDTADLSSADGARSALTSIDDAMKQVATVLGDIGANQNRIQYTQDNLKTTIVNFSAAESVIRDLDMADEMTKFSKNNIISQAATAMLAQANQSTQGVLQLLRG